MAGASDPVAGKSQFVLDSSVALSWCFPDEKTGNDTRLLASLANGVAFVPSQWFLEISSALIVAERRGRVSATESAEALRLLGGLPIRIDDRSGFPLATDLLVMARQQALFASDAAYLELALRLALPLATGSRRLQTAAEAAGVVLYPA
jgi:predicted nucleic acid-binding protein